MKINLFRLKEDKWKDAKRVLHQIWCFQQTPPYFPMWCDLDFQRSFNYIKKTYDLNTVTKKLGL